MISLLSPRSLIFLLHWSTIRSRNSFEKEVTCEHLSKPDNGHIRVAGYSPGSIATYRCKNDFQVKGQEKRTCSKDGKWSDKAPLCTRSCVQPSLTLNNGGVFLEYFNPEQRNTGIKVSYYCNEGYIMEGSRSSVCSSEGIWSYVPPKCNRVTCVPPYPIINGEVVRTGNIPGSTAAYSCESPMVLRGNTTRTCTIHGTWSGKIPRCLPEYETEEDEEEKLEKKRQKKKLLLQKISYTKPNLNLTRSDSSHSIQASTFTIGACSMFIQSLTEK